MRTKVTISLHDEDLLLLERLKSYLEDKDVYLVPSTSEVVRLALKVLAHTPEKTIRAIADRIPERRCGRPKQKR